MISAQEVIDWLGQKNLTIDDPYLALVVPAVNFYVNSLPNIDRDESDPRGFGWAATTYLGATMLAARLYTRKNSQNGVESFGEAGLTYVSRYDSDIARLLNIDTFAKPVIG